MVKRTGLPYTAFKTARGKPTWYYRRGKTWAKLPGDPGQDPEAAKAYWAARSGATQRKTTMSFKVLSDSYRKTPRWSKRAPRTKKDYEVIFAYLEEKVGEKSVLSIERRHVIKAQQDNAHRYRFANYIVQVLSILMEHAIHLGWRRDNPAKGISLLKGGAGYQPWPQWAIDNFTKEAEHGSPERTTFELCLGTGQRVGDVLQMSWGDIEDNGINVTQGKTGEGLWVPFTDRLRAYLATLERGARTSIVRSERGEPMTYGQVEYRARAPRKRAGATSYSFHGLRYNAASELFEAGCTDAQVQAITGHRTRAMVAKYGKGANQRRLGREARSRQK